MKWSPEDTERLIMLCRAGASQGAMARTLKRSKRACEGKLDRLREEGIALPKRNTWILRKRAA